MEAIRLDYMLSSGACIASDSLEFEGDSFDVPIEDGQIIKLWNTPRQDRNWSDHSGPAQLRLLLNADGEERAFVVRVQMDSFFHQNTFYRKLSGAEIF